MEVTNEKVLIHWPEFADVTHTQRVCVICVWGGQLMMCKIKMS